MTRPRAEDDGIYPTYLGIGSAHKLDEPEGEGAETAGRLILPDPEQRHGWREHYVRRAVVRPAHRPIGFRFR